MLTDRLVWWPRVPGNGPSWAPHQCIMYSDGWCEVHLNALRGNTNSNPDYRLIRRQFTGSTYKGQDAGTRWCDRMCMGASRAARND